MEGDKTVLAHLRKASRVCACALTSSLVLFSLTLLSPHLLLLRVCFKGVLFTRNPANGTNELYGEFLINAQGEDVVAGIRTPMPIALMKEKMPNIYTELHDTVKMLERHMHDMQVMRSKEDDVRPGIELAASAAHAAWGRGPFNLAARTVAYTILLHCL